jgi:ABC-type lipoprotein release transport system permease subunit
MLQALGLNQSQIRRIFLRLGFLIGIIGLACGVGLALVLCLIQQHYHLLPLPSVYFIPYLPGEGATDRFADDRRRRINIYLLRNDLPELAGW